MTLLQAATPMAEATVGSIVRDSVLGGLTILAIVVAYKSVMMAIAASDKRVDDAEAHADKLERSSEKDRERQGELATLLREVIASNLGISTSVGKSHVAIEQQNKAIEANTQALNGILREAIGMRRATGSSGSFQAVRKDPRKEEKE